MGKRRQRIKKTESKKTGISKMKEKKFCVNVLIDLSETDNTIGIPFTEKDGNLTIAELVERALGYHEFSERENFI
jgi:hypothetical protein